MIWLFRSLLVLGLAPSFLGITTPVSGAVLRGPVNISGSNRPETGLFSYSEVAFAYAGDPTGTWFLIAAQDQPVDGGVLATWDTTAITDGDYALRLRVYLQDGTTVDVTVSDLHIRNDVPVSTATPPVAAEDLPTPAPSLPAPTPVPAAATPGASPPAESPGNPVSLTDVSVFSTFRRGAAFTLIAFVLMSILLRLRSLR